jgi:hypothetical protein
MATDPPPHLPRAAATGAFANDHCVCCTQGRQEIHADYGSIPCSRAPVSETYRSTFVAGKPKIALFVFIAFLALYFYHAIDSLLENQCRSRVISLTKGFESQLHEKADLFAGVLQQRDQAFASEKANLTAEHHLHVVALTRKYEGELQQRDQAFASEKANLTAEHHLHVVALTRKYEGELQQKDDWVSGELRRKDDWVAKELRRKDDWVAKELRRKDKSLVRERLVLAEEKARLAERDARLAAEWDKLAGREKAVRHEEERQVRDIERRRRSNLHWGPLKWDDACVGWKKMRYFAELHNLPNDVEGVEWCQATSIDIFGTAFEKPEYCVRTAEVG